MDRRIDLALALAFAALGLLIVWQATGIKLGVMRDPVGPRAAFFVCGGGMAVGGLWIALRHVLALRSGAGTVAPNEGTEDTEGHPASLGRAAALIGLCLAYALLFQPLGYLLATPPFIVAALAVLGQRNWLVNVIVALAFTLVAYAVFKLGLGVRLPHGPLTGLFRELGWITL
jgi:putative tricarboxylic transport membrane protein